MSLFRKAFAAAATAAFFAIPFAADAATVRFEASGVAGISGFIEFDDSTFDSTTSQFVSNTEIVALSLDVFGALFSLADVVLTDATIINSFGVVPVIVNGSGNLADNGVTAISFFPDGFDGSPFDGNASMGVGPSGFLAQTDFYAVNWVFVPATIPLPAGLPLLVCALGGLAFLRRRKFAS
jgi:hypothetical protein